MIVNSPIIQASFVVYFVCIFSYNLFAVLVTFMLSSVWHAILDNFRPITIWCTDMFIYYVVTASSGAFGEPWTKYSWVQLLGMSVLLYGTSIYNAPNAGSTELRGKWCLDYSTEYVEIEMEAKEAEIDREWQQRQQDFKMRRPSSLAERSPYVSIYTQALRGLASPKI
jgi:hypothetical protein